MAGLMTPDDNAIFRSMITKAINKKRLSQHRSVGFVFQDYALFPQVSEGSVLLFWAFPEEDSPKIIDELMQMRIPSFGRPGTPGIIRRSATTGCACPAIVRKPRSCFLTSRWLRWILHASNLQGTTSFASGHVWLTIFLVSPTGIVCKLAQHVCVIEQGQLIQGSPTGTFLGKPSVAATELGEPSFQIRPTGVL